MPADRFSDGTCRGSVKGGVISVWLPHIPKGEWCISVAVQEIDEALLRHGNSHYAVREVAAKESLAADERWIEGTKDAQLRALRRKIHESDPVFGKDSCLESLKVDSICRAIKALYEMWTGRRPTSWAERAQEITGRRK